MTTETLDRPRPPQPPPRFGLILACVLELSVALVLVSFLPDRKAWFGLLACVGYAYFSACCSYVVLHVMPRDP